MGFMVANSSMKWCPLTVSIIPFLYICTSVIHAYSHVLIAITFHSKGIVLNFLYFQEAHFSCSSVYEQK